MVTIFVILALLVISLSVAFANSNIFDPREFGPISNTIEINRETPDAMLADQLCKGNISRETYEIFVAEKLSLKLT